MKRKRTPTMVKRIPERVTYYTVPNVTGARYVTGTPVVVAPPGMSNNDLFVLFRSKWRLHRPREKYNKVSIPNTPITTAVLAGVTWDGKFYIKYRLRGTSYLADIHGESLFDIVQITGVEKGGKISGSLVWVSTNSTKYMRLIHTEGERFQEVSHKDDVGSNRIVKKRDLELGVLYESYSGKRGIYLGSVNTVHIRWTYNTPLIQWRIDHSKMLWYEADDPNLLLLPQDVGQHFCDRLDINRFHVKTSHSYRKRIRLVTIIDQEELLPKVRRKALQREPDSSSGMFRSTLMNVYPKGVEPVVSQEVLDFLESEGRIIIPPGTTKEELPRFLTHKNQYVRKEAERYYNRITGGVLDEKNVSTK